MEKTRKFLKIVPGTVWGILLMFVFFTLINSRFIGMASLQNILKNASVLAIVSMGAGMVILSAKIDLSIGYVMSLSAIASTMYLTSMEDPGAPQILLGFAIAAAIGLVFGLFNGLMIGKFKFDYWLITFASMSIANGLSQVVSDGQIISGYSRSFRAVANTGILGIDSVVWLAVLICGIMIFLSTKTRFGYSIYAVGDSEDCAFKSGTNVVRVRVLIYLLSGLLAGIGGILLAARTNSASVTLGSGYEFNAIAAVIVGGTPSEGGKGGLGKTVLGAILITVLKSGLQFSGLDSYWQTLLIGLFIMIVVVADVLSTKVVHKREMRRVYRNG